MSLITAAKLPVELPGQLQRIDRFWQEYRSLSQPVPNRIQIADSKLGDLDCDVVICGGTLGIFIGCALQLKGQRVLVLEQGKLQGRTTISLPTVLLAATDRAVTDGKARSRNDLITRAIQKELALLRRAEIDADLADMAQDAEYQAEVLQMEAEFAVAQWEALQTIETQI